MSTVSFDDDDDDEVARPRQSPSYQGEDTSVTTKLEIYAWYSYAIAAEVFAVVAVGAFVPVLLEQLARERGTFFSDRTKPCVDHPSGSGSTGDSTRFMAVRAENVQKEQCVITFLGSDVTTASFAMYTVSAAVVVQAITLICVSSFADYGPWRKKMLLAFAYTGSVVSALFIFVTPTVFYLAPLLVIIGVTCLGCSFTLLNAFLPLLVSNYPDDRIDDTSSDFELEALNPESSTATHRSDPEKLTRDLERSAKLSSTGLGLGYIAAVTAEILAIGIIVFFNKTNLAPNSPSLPIRTILLFVGIWWALFSIPTILHLRPRPGPPLPTQSKSVNRKRSAFLFYTTFSLSSSWTTFKRAIRLRQVTTFLIAWFLLSDSIATITGTAVLFARTELQMGTIAVALLSMTSIFAGILGAFFWPRIAAAFHLPPKSILLACSLLMECVPLYGLLGYIPFLQRHRVGGLQQPWEIYPLGAIHGFIMGGIGSYTRAVYAPLIPEGSEAAFFALYAVTDKGSSALGPGLVGYIVDRAGTIRPAFIFLAVLAILPGPLLCMLDVEKGRDDASRMARSCKGVEQEEEEDE
ncbi:autophagy-related protein 22-1 [Pleomassaria siparia CBS 279.74]|uniref:Autophagy-related protein n=1 Tax=Pleomassaria siparia CBS 279.74 TaxID=1314801 RepID=A0A6G1KCJ2_9PLEO|nr:autophagy-related protein 22-1 [Pleomassaria siparia CBS 279.74]